MSVQPRDREVLRGLAARVAEIAALPVQAERVRLWKALNGLRPERPMVLAFPQSAWRELTPESELECTDPTCRAFEVALRKKVFQHERIGDDLPIEGFLNVRWVVRLGDFGLPTIFTGKDALEAGRGSYRWDPPVKTAEDLERLHVRSIDIDRAETERQVEQAQEVFGDLLPARIHGRLWWSVGLTWQLIELRGLEQCMIDMYENRELLHRLMALLRDDMADILETFEREGLLTLNSRPMDSDEFLGSGGVGCTDELPAEGFEGHVRLGDMWGLGESQEFVGVGPELFHEFALQYQLPLLSRFGLACYGCCEPLDRKLDLLLEHIPRLRRVSVSAWCDRAVAAEKLAGRCVFSWKPNPALLAGPRVDWGLIEREIRGTLDIARGCAVEIIMKTTETFNGDRERLGRWCATMRRLTEANRPGIPVRQLAQTGVGASESTDPRGGTPYRRP